MNDAHDNAADDRTMAERMAALFATPADLREQAELALRKLQAIKDRVESLDPDHPAVIFARCVLEVLTVAHGWAADEDHIYLDKDDVVSALLAAIEKGLGL